MLTFTNVILFISLNMINVILGTIRSIITVKGTRFQSAIINAVFFTFYVVVIKTISEMNLLITVPITFCTNMIGVYIADWLLKLFKKDRLWRITCRIKNNQTEYFRICKELKENEIEFDILFDENTIRFDVISQNQKVSKQLKEIFRDNITYVIEIEKSL